MIEALTKAARFDRGDVRFCKDFLLVLRGKLGKPRKMYGGGGDSHEDGRHSGNVVDVRRVCNFLDE